MLCRVSDKEQTDSSGHRTTATAVVDGDLLVDVAGGKQHVLRLGSGSPTVVFDAGCGGDASTWSEIAERVSAFTTALAYDRFGCGSSSPSNEERSSGRVVDELRHLLKRLGEKPPYVLVGLSLGGMNMRLYASRYPDEVGGLVLVEPAHEDLSLRMPADYWQHEQEQVQKAQGATRREAEAIETSSNQLRAERRSLGETPLIVITGGTKWGDAPPHVDVRAVDSVWRRLHVDITATSRRSQNWIAQESGHSVHRQDPQLVIDAIRRVVSAVRGDWREWDKAPR